MTSVDTGCASSRHFIGGEWVAPGAATFDDRDPFTGETVARVAAGTRADARRGGRGGRRRPRPAGRQTAPAERQRIFLAAADLLEARRDEVVSWLARETGCTFGFGMFQMGFVPGLFRQAAALAVRAARHGDPVRPPGRRSRWASAGRSASSARSRRGTRR